MAISPHWDLGNEAALSQGWTSLDPGYVFPSLLFESGTPGFAKYMKVLLAAALSSSLILIGGFIAFGRVLWKWYKTRNFPLPEERRGMPKIIHNAFRTYMLATSDTQILLMFSYTVGFWLIQRCTISAYHYTIVINIGLASCANFVLTTAFVSEYWKAPLTGALRFAAMVVVSASVGLPLNEQRKHRVDNPEYLPPYSRKDSTILLPASCFLDPQFKDVYSGLSISERDKIPLNRYQAWEFSLWIVTVILLAAGLLRTIRELKMDRSREAKSYVSWTGLVLCTHQAVALALATILNAIVGWRVFYLRKWVGLSGWIKPGRIRNPENDWRENGQILPMLQLLMIAIFICNEYEFKFYSPSLKASSSPSSIEFDDLQPRLRGVVSANSSVGNNNGDGTGNRNLPYQGDDRSVRPIRLQYSTDTDGPQQRADASIYQTRSFSSESVV